MSHHNLGGRPEEDKSFPKAKHPKASGVFASNLNAMFSSGGRPRHRDGRASARYHDPHDPSGLRVTANLPDNGHSVDGSNMRPRRVGDPSVPQSSDNGARSGSNILRPTRSLVLEPVLSA